MTSTASAPMPAAKIRAGEIVVSNVDKHYGEGAFTKPVVQDCSFTIERGKLTVMIGPSGCGKSTLIRLLAGFEKPTHGSVKLDDKPINGPGKDRLVVFQESALFPWMTTFDNIMYGPRARGEDTKDVRALAEMLLDKVGLRAFRKKYPTQLSGGMQRRAGIGPGHDQQPADHDPRRAVSRPRRDVEGADVGVLRRSVRRIAAHQLLRHDPTSTRRFFLADRLLIMSNVPTRVRAVIEVDIPRPRRLADIVDDGPRQCHQDGGALPAARRGDEVVRRRQQGGGRLRRRLFQAAAAGAMRSAVQASAWSWLLARELMIGLAVAGGAASVAAILLQTRRQASAEWPRRLNRLAYLLMGTSVLIFIVRGLV